MTPECRRIVWPADRSGVTSLDLSFETDVVYDVARRPLGFALELQRVTPPLHKRYAVDWADLADTERTTMVAEREGRLIGVASMEFHAWNRRAALTHLYVDRSARHTGAGQAMLAQLRTAAVRAGARCLWAETQNVNAPAIAWYLKQGFELVGLDRSLYDPAHAAGETALFFALDLSGVTDA